MYFLSGLMILVQCLVRKDYHLQVGASAENLTCSEFNTTAEYTTGDNVTSRRNVNATGYGTSVTVGMEADINGFALSLQEINVMALLGSFFRS